MFPQREVIGRIKQIFGRDNCAPFGGCEKFGMESKAATLWDLVVQGIPDGIRVNVWLTLSGVDEIRARILEKSKLTGREHYNSLVARAELELSEQLQDQIDRDLPRTFPKLRTRFNSPKVGQSVLRRVLFAYAVHDKVLGYCQSLNFVAAFFLCLTNEETAFWLLYAITQKLCPGY